MAQIQLRLTGFAPLWPPSHGPHHRTPDFKACLHAGALVGTPESQPTAQGACGTAISGHSCREGLGPSPEARHRHVQAPALQTEKHPRMPAKPRPAQNRAKTREVLPVQGADGATRCGTGRGDTTEHRPPPGLQLWDRQPRAHPQAKHALLPGKQACRTQHRSGDLPGHPVAETLCSQGRPWTDPCSGS